MAAHEQFYLTCDGCGVVLTDDSIIVKGETEECVRAEAADLGWKCNIKTTDDEPDLCPACQ